MARCANWDRFVHWYKARHVPYVDPIFPAAATKERPPMNAPNPSRWKPIHICFMWLIGCPTAIGLTAVYLSLTNYHERAIHRMEYDALVKQQMIQHGYTVQEIEAVLRANSDEDNRAANNHSDYVRNQLIRDLRKQGMKAEEIERIVRVAYPPPVTRPAPAPRTRTTRTPVVVAEPPAPPEARPAMPFERD